ncbi:hypothetical protein Y1Q_0017346 [Alligator mississippiensis]|uniref:Uncharacterized protein n=1 Tax=Alligator mississippiensis TaxID=8496 RepID=A0A151N7U8_ALLMI|nr:hypothetical protein Y1Q_0017346 [Alligator mississippiensis]
MCFTFQAGKESKPSTSQAPPDKTCTGKAKEAAALPPKASEELKPTFSQAAQRKMATGTARRTAALPRKVKFMVPRQPE